MKHLNLAFAGVVAGSLALSAQAGVSTWWSEDFSDYSLDIQAMTNDYTKGTWTMAAGDGSTLKASYSNQVECLGGLSAAPENVLALSTEGNDLKFEPTPATAVSSVTVVDADVFFVGSESAPSFTDTDIQFAMYLQVPEDGSANAVMVYVRDQGNAGWVALDGTSTIADKTWHHVQVKIDYSVGTGRSVNVIIDGSDKTPEGGLVIANGATSATGLTSVSFRGTGAVDNFAGGWETVDPLPLHTFTASAYVDGVLDQTVEIAAAEDIQAGTDASFEVARTVGTKTIAKIVVKGFESASDTEYTVTDDGTDFTVTPSGLDVDASDPSVVFITVPTDDAATTGAAQTYPALEVWYATPAAPLTGLSKYLGSQVQGEGTAASPWQIPDLATLKALQAAVASNDVDCIGAYYVQTADIDMSSAGAFAGIGTYAANPTGGTAFTGTYDGQGYKITNVDFTQRNYGGVFNQVNGGTIKNLTVSNITCSAFSASVNEGEWGGAIVGNAGNGAKLQNLVAEGTFGTAAIPATHNVAGIVVRLSRGDATDTLVQNCTNNASLYGTYTKLGGICALTQRQTILGGAVVFDSCANNGDITASANANGKNPGVDGIAGIVAYSADETKVLNCANTGSFSSVYSSAAIGEIVGKGATEDKGMLTDQGGNSGDAAKPLVKTRVAARVSGFTYATIDNGVATTISGSPVAGGTYLLEGNAAPVIALAAGESVAFDTALGYTLDDVGITAGTGAVLSSSTSDDVTTYTATAAAAQIGTTNYATLADAVAAAQAGDTVKLLGNVTLDARVEPTVSMTIDLGGNTITRTGTSGNGSAFDVKGGTVVITNGVIDCTQDDTAIAKDGVYAITSRSGSNVTLADLTITVDSECGACAYPFTGSTITIESGTYANVTETPYRYNTAITGMAVNQPNEATQSLIIKGGSFSQYDPQLGDDSGQMTDFTDDGFVAIADGNGHFVVQPGFNVTFDANGGSPAPEAQRIVAGGSAAKPATDPTKEGFAFDGWKLAGSAYDFTGEVVADITLVAAWTEKTDEPPQVDPGTGVADYNTTYGTAVAPIEVTSSAFKVNFVATVPGTYVLMAATTVDGNYAETEITQTVTSAQIGTEEALVTLEDTNMTPAAKFYKIGWEE